MKKIMFNDKYGLTKAVLDRIKTQERQIPDIQPPYKNSEICFPAYFLLDDEPEKHPLWMAYCWKNKDNQGEFTPWIKPRYKEGEIVAVAQSYEDIYNEGSFEGMDLDIYALKNHKGWKNKMYVKPGLMPHQIRITKLKVQKIQNISEEDCLKEGINKLVPEDEIPRYRVLDRNGDRLYSTYDYKDAYGFLIDRLNRKDTWDKNPYVWVYEFELVK